MPNIRATVDWRRFGLGFALQLAAVAAFATALDTSARSLLITCLIAIAAFGLGTSAVVAGAALMFDSFTDSCVKCGDPLATGVTYFPADSYDDLLANLTSGRPLEMLRLFALPRADVNAESTAALEITTCPRCRRVGRVSVCLVAQHEAAAPSERYDHSEPIELNGWSMEQIVAAAEARETPVPPPTTRPARLEREQTGDGMPEGA